MNQKSTLKTLGALFAILLGSAAAAADEPSTNEGPVIISLIVHQSPSIHRPHMPAKASSISCWYDGEYLTIDFADPEGWCDITVVDEDDASVVSSSFDSASPAEVYIGEHANATIYISTESGNEYVGYVGN